MANDKLTDAPLTGEERTDVVKPAPKKRTIKPILKKTGTEKNGPAETNGHKAVSEVDAKKMKTAASVRKTATKKDVPKKAASKKVVAQKVTVKKAATKKKTPVKRTPGIGLQKIIFQLRFHTEYGQDIFISGDHPLLGDGVTENAVPLQYFNSEYWYLVLDLDKAEMIDQKITYHYILRNADGIYNYDWGNDKTIDPSKTKATELLVVDSWNHAGYFENTFYTEPFTDVLLRSNHTAVKTKSPKHISHTLKVKTPLLAQEQTLCLLGSCDALGNWNTDSPLLMGREEGEDFYSISLDLSKELFPVAYKYGVYDVAQQKFIRYEDGNNRVLFDIGKPDRQMILNDGFAVLPNNTWKGAGMAIPVFSLRSENSFGVGEFTDMPLLVDWAKQMGLKMIQLLPINDTTATHSWMDSYPYAAISAFALHPMYLNLEKISSVVTRKRLQKLEKERLRLNALPSVDYEAVTKIKWEYVSEVYEEQKKTVFLSKEYNDYFERNKHWLVPYAAFCYLRDQYGTVDFSKWPAYKKYDAAEINKLSAKDSDAFSDIGLHYFIQYQLHLQLREATAYAHANGIIVKGDIAIGVYRHGADAWQAPELYHLDFQAGAPPDDFAVKGQNWGFPTYNWQHMREDGFAWWKQRFAQMNDYFDAFRIDHILGFFRIWSIPMDAVEGIMGHFVPAIPVHINEFNSQSIWFSHTRYTKPFITENVLWEVFGYDNELVKSLFLKYDGFGSYTLKPEYATQRLVEQHFLTLEQDEQHMKIQQGLYDLISNTILFEEENSNGQEFHFRFGMEDTSSFRYLDEHTQNQLRELYVNYFFRRQDDFWMKEALQKLPALKRVTNMLVCGEDLGLVPACVPDVMRQLGLLSLEIQRMPKDATKEFFHPNDAPYLSVVTPSTHDMSTIRGWWEEDRDRIQQFYNNQLGQWGEAPPYCEAWINKAIVIQHLYSPAMWSVFQLQDLLGMDELLRREDPNEERINIPANPKHYWQYRMHIKLEDLLKAEEYNEELRNYITASGR
ncbi:MAG: 4-alpha-glucanotransferase [Bacteroidota bacterium]